MPECHLDLVGVQGVAIGGAENTPRVSAYQGTSADGSVMGPRWYSLEPCGEDGVVELHLAVHDATDLRTELSPKTLDC